MYMTSVVFNSRCHGLLFIYTTDVVSSAVLYMQEFFSVVCTLADLYGATSPKKPTDAIDIGCIIQLMYINPIFPCLPAPTALPGPDS
jgi:hypothetical protein